MKTLERGDRIVEVFHDLVRRGIARVGADPSEGAEHYLVQLLVERIADAGGDEAVAFVFLRGLAEVGESGRREIRRAGDEALFLSGFAPDSFERSLVDVDYYHRLGRAAYGTLAAHLSSKSLARLFGELAEKFTACADVLWEVARAARVAGESSVLRLYERATKTGSEHLHREVLRRGLTIPVGVGVQ